MVLIVLYVVVAFESEGNATVKCYGATMQIEPLLQQYLRVEQLVLLFLKTTFWNFYVWHSRKEEGLNRVPFITLTFSFYYPVVF